jgi:bacteriocin-like protein
MKLNKFTVEQLSTSELQNVIGGQEKINYHGTHTSSRRTSCSGSDHDHSSRDED